MSSTDPRTFDEFIGQRDVIDNLRILVSSALQRQDAIDHILLHGTAGVGKSSLCKIVAAELGVKMHTLHAPSISSVADIVPTLLKMRRGEVLYIDEIHALPRSVEETLYPVMQDSTLTCLYGQEYPQSLQIELPPFTLVGATTRLAGISSPLLTRFGSVARVNYYPAEDLSDIITRACTQDKIAATAEGVYEIARRSRGTPRTALRLTRRVRDYAIAKGLPLSGETAITALAKWGIDALGLDEVDRKYLSKLCDRHGPMGVEAIAATLNERVDTVEDIIEPYLLLLGLIERTGRGRVATVKGYLHLGRGAEYDQESMGILT